MGTDTGRECPGTAQSEIAERAWPGAGHRRAGRWRRRSRLRSPLERQRLHGHRRLPERLPARQGKPGRHRRRPVGTVQDDRARRPRRRAGEVLRRAPTTRRFARARPRRSTRRRSASIAGREVSLTLPPSTRPRPQPSPTAGASPLPETTSEVDLDQIFNTLYTEDRQRLQARRSQGFDISYSGVAPQANAGLKYANPFLSTSRRVFGELTPDTPAFERLLVDTSHLSGALAERAPDLTQLTHNLDVMMGALASQKTALASTIAKLPAVHAPGEHHVRQPARRARRPRPAGQRVEAGCRPPRPVLRQLPRRRPRRGAHHPRPRRDHQPAGQPERPHRAHARRRCRSRRPASARARRTAAATPPPTSLPRPQDNNFKQGALGEATCALQNGLPQLSFLRPYTPELVGWFDDFATVRRGRRQRRHRPRRHHVQHVLGVGRGHPDHPRPDVHGPLQHPPEPADLRRRPARVRGPGGPHDGQVARCPGALERDRRRRLHPVHRRRQPHRRPDAATPTRCRPGHEADRC